MADEFNAYLSPPPFSVTLFCPLLFTAKQKHRTISLSSCEPPKESDIRSGTVPAFNWAAVELWFSVCKAAPFPPLGNITKTFQNCPSLAGSQFQITLHLGPKWNPDWRSRLRIKSEKGKKKKNRGRIFFSSSQKSKFLGCYQILKGGTFP